MDKKIPYACRVYRFYNAAGPEVDELRAMADEVIADILAPEITTVSPLPGEEVEKEWFRIGDKL